MKKLTHLGCLLALVFAGASAFADPWFNDVVKENSGNGWSVPAGRWVWYTTYGALNDWDVGAVYTVPEAKKDLSSYDSKITTTVKFTAMDPEDLNDYAADASGAKAGVTVVEVTGTDKTTYDFKVVMGGQWVDAGVSTNSLANPITVTVKFDKTSTGSQVTYVIGGTTVAGGTASGSISTVAYKGQCDLYTDLAGLAWSNNPQVPTSITVPASDDYVGPPSIKYNHGDLKARFAERGQGENADDDAQVIAYMANKQANGQFGWVNYALGQADNLSVGIQSNDAAVVEGKLSFDFGFVVDENYVVSYTVDKGDSAATAEVGIESGVHTVAVTVKEKNGTESYGVTNQIVGVMQAESPASVGKGPGTNVYEIVAVPWEAFGHGAVTVENLLVTSLLTEGDTLYVWNNGGYYYDTYKLTSGKWDVQDHTSFSSQTGAVTVKGTPAQDNALVQGTAVWIEHDVRSKIVFTGMLENDDTGSKVTTIVYGGAEDTWTLVANPSIKPFALTGISGAAPGDRVVIEDAADPREYECKLISEVKVWGYDKKVKTGTRTIRGQTIDVYSTEWTVVADSIPAGIGFWYVRKAGGSDFTITFGNNDVAE